MINRISSLKAAGRFDLKEESLVELEDFLTQHVDTYQLETVLCLELVINSCYQMLARLSPYRNTREEYQRFELYAQFHQEKLRKIFPLSEESETAVENKVYQCLIQVHSSYLFLKAIIGLALTITTYKIGIYEHFSRTHPEHHELLDSFVVDSIEEMNFLYQERRLQQNNPL